MRESLSLLAIMEPAVATEDIKREASPDSETGQQDNVSLSLPFGSWVWVCGPVILCVWVGGWVGGRGLEV